MKRLSSYYTSSSGVEGSIRTILIWNDSILLCFMIYVCVCISPLGFEVHFFVSPAEFFSYFITSWVFSLRQTYRTLIWDTNSNPVWIYALNPDFSYTFHESYFFLHIATKCIDHFLCPKNGKISHNEGKDDFCWNIPMLFSALPLPITTVHISLYCLLPRLLQAF